MLWSIPDSILMGNVFWHVLKPKDQYFSVPGQSLWYRWRRAEEFETTDWGTARHFDLFDCQVTNLNVDHPRVTGNPKDCHWCWSNRPDLWAPLGSKPLYHPIPFFLCHCVPYNGHRYHSSRPLEVKLHSKGKLRGKPSRKPNQRLRRKPLNALKPQLRRSPFHLLVNLMVICGMRKRSDLLVELFRFWKPWIMSGA